MMPTETELRHFEELYRTRHFARAAIRIGISQPTLTQSIQRLEEKIEASLFVRTKQGCVPTRAAEVLLKRSKQLLSDWKDLGQDLRDLAGGEASGRFTIGCHASVGTYVLPPFLTRLRATAPAVEVSLIHDSSRKILEKLIAYEIDLAFIVNPVRHPDLVLKRIGADEFGFWKAEGLKSTEVPKTLIFDPDLLQVQSLLERGKALTHEKLATFSRLYTSSLELNRTLTESGAGVGALPGRIARVGKLVRFDSALPTFRDEIYVAYRKAPNRERGWLALVECARAELAG